MSDSKLREEEILEQARQSGRWALIGAFIRLSGPGWLGNALTLGAGSLAGSRYQDMPNHADFVKSILYHDILGPRLPVNYLEPLQQGLLKELTLQQSLNLVYAWFGHSPDTEPNLSRLAEGLSPDYVCNETKRAVDGVAGRAAVYSGIGLDIPKGGGWGTDVWQSDADEVYQAVRKAFDAGASGIVASREYDSLFVFRHGIPSHMEKQR